MGIYSSEQEALKAIERYYSLAGFKKYPKECFVVDKYIVNEDNGWKEGFVSSADWNETLKYWQPALMNGYVIIKILMSHGRINNSIMHFVMLMKWYIKPKISSNPNLQIIFSKFGFDDLTIRAKALMNIWK